jgi:hypothetical protein
VEIQQTIRKLSKGLVVGTAKNILARALRFEVVGLAGNEAVRGNPEQVILRAEASKLTHLTKS